MEEAYTPAQYAQAGGIAELDLRGLAKSHDKSSIPNRDPGHASGGKRKRDAQPEPEAGDVAMLGDGDAAPAEAAAGEGRARKKRAYDAVSGAVSQRPWKAPFGRASSIAVRPPPPPGDWEVKMAEKERKRGIQDAVRKLKDEAKAAAAAERARRADVKKRKEQNRRKSSGVQKITNPKKLAKLSKKQHARLAAAGAIAT